MKFTHRNVPHGPTGDLYIVEAFGRLDAAGGAAFEKEIQGCLDEGCRRIVIDMAEVDFINSAGLRSVMSAAKAARSLQGELQFCGLKGVAAEVFKIAGFESMFKTFESIVAAIGE